MIDHVTAGADINEIAALDSDGARKVRYLEDICNGLSGFRKPLLAAVEGMAVCHPFLPRPRFYFFLPALTF